jgi:hypothetical protein
MTNLQCRNNVANCGERRAIVAYKNDPARHHVQLYLASMLPCSLSLLSCLQLEHHRNQANATLQ